MKGKGLSIRLGWRFEDIDDSNEFGGSRRRP